MYKVYVNIKFENDTYIHELDGVEYDTREAAQTVINEVKDYYEERYDIESWCIEEV